MNLEDLNQEQLQAVKHCHGNLLVLAGAGSGKTRVITHKIAWLIEEQHIFPHQILAVTFTNKAAREMRERIAAITPSGDRVIIRTFHSFGAYCLRRYGRPLGINSNFSIYDDDDSLQLMKLSEKSLKQAEAKALRNSISRAKDHGYSPDDVPSDFSYAPDFPRHFGSYQKALEESGNLDFGDLIVRTRDLYRMGEGPKYRAILVDEFQDSNIAQLQLLQAMYHDNCYLCVVGDDDQSIYRFRGAEVQNILDFDQTFTPTEVIKLQTNYRSTSAILDLANHVISHNQGRIGKELHSAKGGGSIPELHVFEDQDQEARWVSELMVRSPDLPTAILYRTNAQSRSFESSLLRHGINYTIVGSVRFYEREEIKDALALLRLTINPKDRVSFRRIVNKPSRGIGPKAQEAIEVLASKSTGNLVDACSSHGLKLSRRALDGARDFALTIQRAQDSLADPSKNLGETIHLLMEETGLLNHHREQDEVQGSQKLANLDELANAAASFGTSTEDLALFLETIELDSQREEGGTSNCTLITMHNTKGLEFERVVITGLEEGLFPRNADDPEEEEEERRLFYVAITRAKTELHLSYCRNRLQHGRYQSAMGSRFLDEIPSDLLQLPSYLEPNQPKTIASNWKKGQRVYHDEYGEGSLYKVAGSGQNEVLHVYFDTGTKKVFFSAYTQLEKIASS